MEKILIILPIIILIICIFSKQRRMKRSENVENFTCDTDTTDEENNGITLTDSQMNQIQQMVSDQTMSLMNSTSSFMQGPQGNMGQQGPPGGTYQAAGRLVNQSASYKNKKQNAFNPGLVTTRTSGTLPTQSLCLMDTPTLGSFQYWYLNKNGTLENKYDGKCINYNPTKASGTKVYMGNCSPSNFNQWTWDKNNRLLFNNGDQQCLSLSKPESGVSTTTMPGCDSETECIRPGDKMYLQVKKYTNGTLYDDEVWSFI